MEIRIIILLVGLHVNTDYRLQTVQALCFQKHLAKSIDVASETETFINYWKNIMGLSKFREYLWIY